MRTAEHVSTFSQFWPVLLTRISTIWSASPEQFTTGKNFPVDAPDLGSSLGPRCNTTADVQASNPRKSHPDATVPVRHVMAHVGSLGQHLPTRRPRTPSGTCTSCKDRGNHTPTPQQKANRLRRQNSWERQRSNKTLLDVDAVAFQKDASGVPHRAGVRPLRE